MVRNAFVIVLVFLAGVWHSLAANPQETLQKANQAYVSEEYALAAELYESIIAQGYEAAELFYNLGNAYFRQNKIGRAILNYERSLKLNPGKEDTQFNLRVANASIVDQITPIPLIFYKRWWNGIYSLLSNDGWALAGVLFLSFAMVGLGVFVVFRSVKTKKTALGFSLLLLLLAVISILAARATYYQSFVSEEAIVMVSRTSVRSSPSADSPDLFFIHEGTKGRLTGELGEWYEIRLANGNTGWIQKTAIEVI